MKHATSPRGGRLIAGLLTSMFCISAAVATENPHGPLTADRSIVRSQAGWQVQSASGAPSDLKQSRILHDGKNWTVVPKGSVIYLPETLTSKVDFKPVGNLLPFDEFLDLNRSWITTNEVTFDQAAGNEPLLTRATGFWSKQDKMVVAVHRLAPISVTFADETLASTDR